MSDRPLLIDAETASRRLGVSKATLYAYVSRRLLRAHPDPADPRARRYAISEIDALKERRDRPKRATDQFLVEHTLTALDRARPIVRTALTTIADGMPHYRGRNALKLARQLSVEEASGWLWKVDVADAFVAARPATPAAWATLCGATSNWPVAERTIARYAVAHQVEPGPTWLTNSARVASLCGQQLRLITAAFLGTEPSAQCIPAQLVRCWRVSRRAEDSIRETMVLLADHPINQMTFASRLVASIDAGLGPAILAGLCAISGKFTAGRTEDVHELWDSLSGCAELEASVTEKLRQTPSLPGFNHPYYPDGDPRARRILELALQFAKPPPFLTAIATLSDQRPTVDFALVALCRAIKAPPEAAAVLLYLSRSIGIIAHALEQRRSGRRMFPGAYFEPDSGDSIVG
jgi:citrate synthase